MMFSAVYAKLALYLKLLREALDLESEIGACGLA
jgi:hypothetical protein